MKGWWIIVLVLIVVAGLGGFVLMRSNNPSKSVDIEIDNETTSPQVSPTIVVVPTTEATSTMVLKITSPVNGATVTNTAVSVRGTTSAGADVFVNEVETKADSKGNFSANLDLEDGENFIVVTAIDDEGNAAEQELTVTLNGGV